ncbi:Transposase IS4 [Popillia japonica]|uniref:Transposase IS4 n=1 Tax=Popillia japonica TaxID=7064 RepID=A0AAW1I8C9_POPJA
MCSYEKEQEKLALLWSEILSDEENNCFQSSSEEYEPSEQDYSSSDNENRPLKKRKTLQTDSAVASTSRQFIENSMSSLLPDSVTHTIENVINLFRIDDSSDEDNEHLVPSIRWAEVTGSNMKIFHYDVLHSGTSHELFGNPSTETPMDFFRLFLNTEVLEHCVTETNRYEAQKRNANALPKARINRWKDTSIDEMEIFIGIQIWMGLVNMPRLADYWTSKVLYKNQVSKVMSRNRFELLLANWHFSNNEDAETTDRLYKISPLTTLMVRDFKKYFTPKQDICIDETLVPFRGRLSFLQFIKDKRHKFGIKLFKLCVDGGSNQIIFDFFAQGYKMVPQASSGAITGVKHEFREQISLSPMHLETNANLHPLPKPNEQHKLVDVGTTNRRRCVSCYSKISEENGRNVAAKKTPHSRWKCMSCNKFYCVTCFCDAHTCTL